MRIRFRLLCESDLELQIFSSDNQNKYRLCKSKQPSCAKSDAEMVLGSFICLLV